MKKLKQYFSLALVIILAAIICSCNQDAAPSLFGPAATGSTPVISSVSPADAALAGVSEVSINGSNFSSVNGENFVYFGTVQATVLQSSPTQLVVQAPVLIQNNLDVKIAVSGAENFSNIVKYNLLEAVGVYYAFTKGIDDPYTVTVDNNENVFVYLKDKGIKKISSTGVLTDFAPKGSESFFFDMKVGPKEGNDNVIYGARKVNALFKVVEGKSTSTYVVFPTGKAVEALDFDVNKNIWAAGSGGNIYSVTPLKVFTPFPIDYTVSALRVYNEYLYVAGKNSTEEAIYRYKINSNLSLGSKEKYFDIGAKYGLNKVLVGAMTFAVDGNLIIGTDQTDAFIAINPDGTSSSFYPGLISPFARSLAWGTMKNLFYIREYLDSGSIIHALVRVDMQKLSAPYFGRQ